MSATYEFPRPALTVDCVVFGLDGGRLSVLLVRRGLEPFRGRWALPGGFVHVGESLEQAARRELAEETGLERLYLEQLYTFGEPGRDPREHVVSVAYYALVNLHEHGPVAASDAESAGWFALDDLPRLAFDHARIVASARERLQAKVRYRPLGFELLPELFTLAELQRLYEAILGRPLDKRNFRKKVRELGILAESGEVQQDVAHRAAVLYRFDRRAYERLMERGFDFAL
ncbi:MAG: NUDIX domain-containing protein [Planctomycetota bacterium]